MRIAIAVMTVIVMSACVAGATSLSDAWPVATDAEPDGALRQSTVIDSFPSPGGRPMGLAYSQDGMYHVDEARGDVYFVYTDGTAIPLFSVLDEIGCPESADCGNGICFVSAFPAAGSIYIADYNGHRDEPGVDRVYRFYPDIVRQEWLWESWDVSAFADGVIGITSRYGTVFWLTTAGGEIIECNDNFEELARYALPGYSGGDIDWQYGSYDNDRLYLIDYISGVVYACDLALNVLYSFDGHPTATNMVGVTVGSDVRGKSVWTSTFGSVDPPIGPYIFAVDDVLYNPVETASWGRIKAAYR